MAYTNSLVHLNMNGNEIQNVLAQNLATAPSTNVAGGRFYFDTTDNTLYVYNGTNWLDALAQGTTYIEGGGIDITNSVISIDVATGANAGNITLTTTNGLSANAPSASTSTAGLIEIATDAEVSTGTDTSRAVTPKQLAGKVNKLSTAPTAGTYTKLTINTDGLVTGGASLQASDIPDISATYVKTSLLGANSGVATLGSDGKVPSSQLPSFVDDVIDAYIVSGATALSAGWLSKTSGASALTPETDKIYVIVSSGDYQNKTYRWSGTTYVEISASPGAASESAAGIIEIATQTETNTGTDDTRAVTPLKLATYVNGMTKKLAATNGALTASGGVCTWTVTNSLSTADVQIQVYDTTSNTQVLTENSATSSTITIKINSSSNISSGKYRMVAIG